MNMLHNSTRIRSINDYRNMKQMLNGLETTPVQLRIHNKIADQIMH